MPEGRVESLRHAPDGLQNLTEILFGPADLDVK